MKNTILTFAAIVFSVSLGVCHPPDAPLTDYGPAKMAVGFYFDHCGQDIFDDPQRAGSVLNTTGVQLTYAPARIIQAGVYLGAAEFDHHGSADDPDNIAFDADYAFTFGLAGKLFTPRFLEDKMRVFLGASGGYLKVEDDFKNIREIFEYHTALGLQYQAHKAINLAAGGELYYIDGDQGNDTVAVGENPFGNRDLFRGLVSAEWYPKTNPDLIQGKPFLSLSFRFTGDLGWDRDLGMENASISFSLGLITDFLYGKYKEGREEQDQRLPETD